MSFSPETGNSFNTSGYDLLPGQLVLNTWEVLEPLGRGGMGAVYRVYHRFLQKEMAMKTLRCDQVTDVNWRRFLIEAKAIAKLEHPNIVQIFDMGTAEDGQPFYTMELLNGQGVDRWIRNEPLNVVQSISLFRQVASALAFAHERGIIHRDIKPANIVLGFSEGNRPPVVKVVDFGIARLGLESQGLTKEGEVFGSPLYMSPEQVSGLKVDQRSDVYSFGCAFYETLTGSPPFKGASAFETMMMHLDGGFKPIEFARPDIKFPPGLSALVQMLLAKNPDQRYSNASQIVQDLLQIERGLGLKVASRLQTASQTRLEDWIDSDERQITEQLTIPMGRTGSQSRVNFNSEQEKVSQEKFDSVEESSDAKERFSFRGIGLLLVGVVLITLLGSVIFLSSEKSKSGTLSITSQDNCFYLDENQMEDLRKTGMSFDAHKKYYRFDTSDEECIGEICELPEDDSEPKTWPPASGVVGVLRGRSIAFRPSRYLLAHPQLWRKFRSRDLQAIWFPDSDVPIAGFDGIKGYTLSNENIQELARFELLESIDFGHGIVSPQSAEIVGKFLNLRRLVFYCDNTVSASEIEKMDCVRLDRLDRLDLPRLVDAGSVIAFLRKSKRIEYLAIPYLICTTEDIAAISNLKTLVELHLAGGSIPRGGIKLLGRMPRLRYLSLATSVVPVEEAESFFELEHLKRLVLAKDVWGDNRIFFSKFAKRLHSRGVELLGVGFVVQSELHQNALLRRPHQGPGNSQSAVFGAPSFGGRQKVENSCLELIQAPEDIQRK